MVYYNDQDKEVYEEIIHFYDEDEQVSAYSFDDKHN